MLRIIGSRLNKSSRLKCKMMGSTEKLGNMSTNQNIELTKTQKHNNINEVTCNRAINFKVRKGRETGHRSGQLNSKSLKRRGRISCRTNNKLRRRNRIFNTTRLQTNSTKDINKGTIRRTKNHNLAASCANESGGTNNFENNNFRVIECSRIDSNGSQNISQYSREMKKSRSRNTIGIHRRSKILRINMIEILAKSITHGIKTINQIKNKSLQISRINLNVGICKNVKCKGRSFSTILIIYERLGQKRRKTGCKIQIRTPKRLSYHVVMALTPRAYERILAYHLTYSSNSAESKSRENNRNTFIISYSSNTLNKIIPHRQILKSTIKSRNIICNCRASKQWKISNRSIVLQSRVVWRISLVSSMKNLLAKIKGSTRHRILSLESTVKGSEIGSCKMINIKRKTKKCHNTLYIYSSLSNTRSISDNSDFLTILAYNSPSRWIINNFIFITNKLTLLFDSHSLHIF